MPSLHWTGKTLTAPQPACLELDAVVYTSQADNSDTFPSNNLFQGDNLGIMAALLPEYEGRIHLIYADPPFFTNRHFQARVGRGEDSRKPNEWQLAPGYADHW